MNLRVANLSELHREHERFLAEIEIDIAAAMNKAGNAGIQSVQQRPGFTPRTGKTQKATDFRIVRTSRGRVMRLNNSAKHADALDQGASPHLIVPRRGRFLRFIGRDGRTVFTRRVRHPGNKPYRFMANAYAAANIAFRIDLERRLTALGNKF